MTKTKTKSVGALSLLLFLAALGTAHAAPEFTLRDNASGKHYQCSAGGSGPVDAECIRDLTQFCYEVTNNSRATCFESSKGWCLGAPVRYVVCVKELTQQCFDNTGNSRATCF